MILKRDVIETISVRIILIFAGLFASILTARFLGPEGRGDYFFVVTVAAIIGQFGNLGLHSSNTYLVAKDSSLLGKLLANSVWISIVTGGVIAIAIVVAMSGLGFITPGASRSIWFAVFLAPATTFFMLGTNLLVGVKKIKIFNIFQLSGNCLVVVFMGVAIFLGLGVSGFLAASVVAWSLSGVFLFIVLARYSGKSFAFDSDTFKVGFRYAMKAYLATLLGFLVLRCNVLLLTNMTGSKEVGFYSVAVQIADVIGIMPASMGLVLFPDMVRDASSRWAMTIQGMALTASILACICVAAVFLTEPMVLKVFGPDFLPAVPMLLWMLPGIFFLGVTTIISQYLASIGFPRLLVLIWCITFFVAGSLGWLMIKSFHGVGASMALSITYALLFLMVLGLTLRIEYGREKDGSRNSLRTDRPLIKKI